jgi:hypothetical protein
MVTPLTAAVLAAVDDADLGEASAINDASARVGALIAIGLLPVLLGTGAGADLQGALDDGYRRAMIAIALVSLAAALVAAIFVSDGPPADAPRLAAPAPHHGCALPTQRAEVIA